MKVLYIFRGEMVRQKNCCTDPIIAYENWKKTIFIDELDYDVAFITYISDNYEFNIFRNAVQLINPKFVIINEKISQTVNCKNVCDFLLEHQFQYDRFIILRFDVAYRCKINDFPNFYKKGIHLLNRDVHFPTTKYYSDVLFIVDHFMVDIFTKQHLTENNGDPHYIDLPHMIGRNLFIKNIPFYCILGNKYYHNHDENHPIIYYLTFFDSNTEKIKEGKEIDNVEIWNPQMTKEQIYENSQMTESQYTY